MVGKVAHPSGMCVHSSSVLAGLGRFYRLSVLRTSQESCRLRGAGGWEWVSTGPWELAVCLTHSVRVIMLRTADGQGQGLCQKE